MIFAQFSSGVNKRYLVLLAVFIVSLSLRLWLLDKRWINPDEGAHLMDALLAMDGKIPGVDYSARQPIYIYSICGILKLFGTNYISGRILPVSCSMLIGIVMFLMARALFDEKVALLSSAIYWMLPLELFNSPIVKTEPLVVLLTCLSLYAAIRFSQYEQKPWLIISGVLAAMGFYVRQSTLIIPLIVLAFLTFFHKGRFTEIAKNLGLFLVGYIGVFLLAFCFYSRFMSPYDFLTSSFSPFEFLALAGRKLFSVLRPALGSGHFLTSPASIAPLDQHYYYYYKYIRDAFHLHSFLIIGSLFSVVSLGLHVLTHNRQSIREHIISYSLLYLWMLFLFVAYTFYFYTRGFFIDYFREFLPPLVIIFSAWIRYSISAFNRDWFIERFILGGLSVSAILFLIQLNHKGLFVDMGFQASLAIALAVFFRFLWSFKSSIRKFGFMCAFLAVVVLILLSRHIAFKPYFSGIMPELGIIGMIYAMTWAFLEKKTRPSLQSYAKFVGHSIVLGSFIVSVSFSGFLLSLTYDSIWSPQSVEKTAQYLKTHTAPNDEVMSGAVIWELQALRKPFHMISHPLGFISGISEKQREKLKQAFKRNPPRVIILDGYTEKTYISQIPWVNEFIKEEYELKGIKGPAKYPVKIYQLNINRNQDENQKEIYSQS